MTAFEDFVNLELPKRRPLLLVSDVSYDGDPNDGGAPAILKGAPIGTWYLRETPSRTYYTKENSGAADWVEGGGGGGGTPGGADTQAQFNDGGSFGGDASYTFNKTSRVFAIGSDVSFRPEGAGANSTKVGQSALANGQYSSALGTGAQVLNGSTVIPGAAATGNVVMTVPFSGIPAWDGYTVTIGDGVLTKTFEFDSGGGVAPGNIAVPVTPGDLFINLAISFGGAFATSGLNISVADGGSFSTGGLGGIIIGNYTNLTEGAAGNVAMTSTLFSPAELTLNGLGGGSDPSVIEVQSTGSLAFGSASCVSPYSMVGGYSATAIVGSDGSVVWGAGAYSAATGAFALGRLAQVANAAHTNAGAIGYSAASTAANRLTVGTIGGANPMELQLGKGILLGGSTTAMAGAVEWDGSNFRGHNGFGWVNLDSAGSGAPGGANTQVQFNNAGAFGGSANLTFDGSSFTVANGVALLSPGAGANSFVAGPSAVAAGLDAISIGNGASGPGEYVIAIGKNSVAGAVTVGYRNSIAIGNTANALTPYSIAIGFNAQILTFGGHMAIGRDTVCSGSATMALGPSAHSSGNGCISIGLAASTANLGTNSIALGNYSSARYGGIAFGQSSSASGLTEPVALGHTATATATSCISLGTHANSTADRAMALGGNSTASHADSISVGYNAISTGVNRMTVGTIGGSYDKELQIGLGLAVWGVAPPAAQPTITGSRGGATAAVLASVLTALHNTGILIDSTTA